MSDASDPFAAGMAVRREVLGGAHVDRAEASKTPFDTNFQRFITETAWGKVWARDDLSRRERSMITLAILATLGQWEEFAMHVRAARNTGTSADDIAGLLMHVAVYAGVPAGNHAFKIAKAAIAEADRAAAAGTNGEGGMTS
ncbi:4-carboxymuconolactone decarboxylase [Acuticoccus kandeliae]|uniref:4-carboxymuconolactone decarboxylase n=1 Tax=Acuticoccus kandeliae TaxID=2073160 RepID=UPI000D3E197D|nr:4-carboxymuconolactone decarboxylase [Acuticoccus kandeliae]